MINLEKDQRFKVTTLFSKPSSSIVLSSVQGSIGQIWVDDIDEPLTALICAGSTFYIAGKTEEYEMVLDTIKKCSVRNEFKCFEIIPQTDLWCDVLEMYVDGQKGFELQKTYRHLMQADLKKFDINKLQVYASSLPVEFMLTNIDEMLFGKVKADSYTINFIEYFDTYEEFAELGVGCLICKEGEIIGGATSYSRYDQGIEVQIAISPEYRGFGLATACGAKLILECISKGLYPWWDCANPTSERVANKLGYSFDRITKVYRYQKDVQ